MGDLLGTITDKIRDGELQVPAPVVRPQLPSLDDLLYNDSTYTMEKFDLHAQYQLYLQRVGLLEANMHPAQRVETKRAFFGALGQLLILMRDDVDELSTAEAVDALKHMLNQVSDYWASQK